MPLGFKQVNGRWVTTGGTTAEEEVPQELAPARPRQRVTAKAKPKPKPKTGFDKLRNDLLYEADQISKGNGLRRLNEGANAYGKWYNQQFWSAKPAKPGGLPPSMKHRDFAAIGGAVSDVVQIADALYQRNILKKPKAGGSPVTAFTDLWMDNVYKALGVQPPSEMSRQEYEWDKNRRTMVPNVALALLAKDPRFLWMQFGAATAKTTAGGFVRSGAAFALNEALSTYLTDNRTGNISNLVAGLTGQNIPSAVTPQDDLVDAANKSLVPNALASAGLGLAADLAVKGIKRLPAIAKKTGQAGQAVSPEPGGGGAATPGPLDPLPKRRATWHGRRRPPERNVIYVPEPSELQDYLGRPDRAGSSNPDLGPLDASPVQKALGEMEQRDALGNLELSTPVQPWNLRFTAKAIRDRRTVAKVTASRAGLDSAGHTITDPETGATRFNPLAAVDAAKNMEEANAAIATWIGDTKAAVDAQQAMSVPDLAAWKAGQMARQQARAANASWVEQPPAAPAPAAPAPATADWLTPDTYSKEKPPLPPMEGPMVDPWTGALPGSRVIAVPEPSPLQDALRPAGPVSPAPDPLSVSPVQQALGAMDARDTAAALDRWRAANPGMVAPVDNAPAFVALPGGAPSRLWTGSADDWFAGPTPKGSPLPPLEGPLGNPWVDAPPRPPAPPGRNVVAVPEPSPLQDYLLMRFGRDGFEPEPWEASPAQKTLMEMEARNPSPERKAPEAEADAAPQADANASGLDPENPDVQPIYDPALLEADAFERAIGNLSDTEQAAAIDVVARTGADPVEVIEQIASSRIRPEPGTGPNPRLRAENVMAPEASVSELVTGDYEGQLRAMGEEQLRDLVHPDNSPDLSAFIENNASKEFEDLDLGDMLDGLEAWRAYSGEVAIPREYSSLDVVRVADLRVDPVTYQYKNDVDAEGVTKGGGALHGVTKWNPALEQVVEVWDNPALGTLDVVNGHHSVAKAKELGIPTIPVRRIVARDAAEARAMGAAANIVRGSGTNFDAAKFFRDFGITSPKQLDAIGASFSSGKVGDGFALARLPEDMFRDAVDGLLPDKFAIAIGEAGLDEPTTRALYGALKKNPGMSEDAFSQLVQLGQGLREAAPRAAAGGAQPTIPGMEEMFSDLVPKANLLSAIEAELKRQKTTANRVVRDAERLTEIGNQIDVGSTKAASKETRDLLDLFKRDKLLAGPLSDLLNAGTAEVVGGAKVKPIADRIIGQFRRLVEQGIEPTPVTPTTVMPRGGRQRRGTPITDALAGDLNELGQVLGSQARTTGQLLQFGARQLDRQEGQILAQADELQQQGLLDMPPQVASLAEARQADLAAQAREPAPLAAMVMPPELRQQTTNALLGDAIAKGSVRPPATPIPESSPGPTVDLNTATQALDELAASGRPIEPGSTGAQVAADELRFTLEAVQQDAQISQLMHEAASDAAGLELRPFAEKQELLGDGFDRPMAAEPAVPAAAPTGFRLPDDLQRSAPRYSYGSKQFQLRFANDLDRAGYILANDVKTVSKAAPKFREAVEAAGYNVAEIAAHGDKVRAAIKAQARNAQPGVIELPDQGFGRGATPASAPTLAPAPVKPEPVSLTSGATATPTQIRAKFTDAQERAIFSVAKTIPEIDGRTLFGDLRAGRFDAGQARQLVDAAKKVSKPPAVLKKAIATLEEALGVPTAIKADSANIQSELGANKAKKDALKNQAAKEGC